MRERCLRPDCNYGREPVYIWGGYCSEDCSVRHQLDIANDRVQLLKNEVRSLDGLVMWLRRLIVLHYWAKGWDQGDKADLDLWTMADAPEWALWIFPVPDEKEA